MEKINRVHKIKLGDLSRALNQVTGGSSSDYTGYICKVTAHWEYLKVFRDQDAENEEDIKKIIRNCKIYIIVRFERKCVVPKGFEYEEKFYPTVNFDKMPVYLCDKVGNDAHVYDFIKTNFEPSEQENSLHGLRAIIDDKPAFIALDCNRLNPRNLTVTLKDSDIARKNPATRKVLNDAIAVIKSEAKRELGDR